MEQLTPVMEMLDLIVQPAFCVKDGVIAGVNQAAQANLICVGTKIDEMLLTGQEEYHEFTEGCLYLALTVSGQRFGASVTVNDGYHVFKLEQDSSQPELQAMALAARELREPLAGVMTVADRLFPQVEGDEAVQEQIARINRGLFQMLRLISNMSDAARYTQEQRPYQETRDITSIFDEVFRQAAALVSQAGMELRFTNLPAPVYCLVDAEKIERAVYNILSNAIRFTPDGGVIEARVVQRGSKLSLTVQDSGSGVDPKIRGNVFSRYLRAPGVEDGRFGIGLGMVIIRSAAAAHGGTVLMEYPQGMGTRITMTMEIRQDRSGSLHTPRLKVDYAGERDHGLIELSNSLPHSLYEKDKIN